MAFMWLPRAFIILYDIVTLPFYYFRHKVYRKQHEIEQVEHSRQLDPFDPSSPWAQVNVAPSQLGLERQVDAFETYDEMMRHSFKKHAGAPCYGYRQVVREQWIKKPASDGSAPAKMLRQVALSEYKWVTFQQFDRQIEAARRGLIVEGIRSGHKVLLYADTRPEWQIVSQALIRLGAVVVTMYSTSGVDGIVHSINETQVSHVVTQKDKVNKLLRLKSKLPKLSNIIYFEEVLSLPESLGGCGPPPASHGDDHHVADKAGEPSDFEHAQLECLSFRKLVDRGLQLEASRERELLRAPQQQADPPAGPDAAQEGVSGSAAPTEQGAPKKGKDSIALIMYTSGSTGIPKGVLISHRNIMATLKSFTYVTKDFIYEPDKNISIAYLPLAHIYEFNIESIMLYHGCAYGFATPHTLTDKSPGLIAGQKGDLSLLRPTVMIIVPLILDRIVQGVKQALRAESYFKEQLVSYLIKYKIHWQQRHYETPLVDRIVCDKMRQSLGGRMKYVICGSAPLSSETQTFVRAALNLKLPQGFGTTETCAATACQLFDDQSTGNVGVPVSGARIKLEPWLEGNYRPTDRPHPRGEIVVGGDMIAHGYFNLDQQTKEAFYVDAKGLRWYRTGDIGEFLPNGNLKIIDRKKDLVKLQNGEYISLGKVESTLKSNPFTDNFCVYANPAHNYIVALGPANEPALRSLAQQIVLEFERQNSPSVERCSLVGSGSSEQVSAALEELREIVNQYEEDRLNNNHREVLVNGASTKGAGNPDEDFAEADGAKKERKMSSLSTSSTANNCAQTTNQNGAGLNVRLNKLCNNRLINERVLEQLRQLSRERNLMTLEVPKRILILAEEWTEDKNLVTAALKIRRNYIYKRYEKELEHLFYN